MGHGEEGLKRALAWGKKTVTGSVLDDTASLSLDISHIDISKVRFPEKRYTLESIGMKRTIQSSSMDTTILASQEKIDDIETIRTRLRDLGYSIDASFTGGIFQYQKDHGIVTSLSDTGA